MHMQLKSTTAAGATVDCMTWQRGVTDTHGHLHNLNPLK